MFHFFISAKKKKSPSCFGPFGPINPSSHHFVNILNTLPGSVHLKPLPMLLSTGLAIPLYTPLTLAFEFSETRRTGSAGREGGCRDGRRGFSGEAEGEGEGEGDGVEGI